MFNKGLFSVDWNKISEYEDSDISYFLFLEGKSIESISIIRNIERSKIEAHIIYGKVKYRLLTGSETVDELFQKIKSAGKDDKNALLHSISDELKNKLSFYLGRSYYDFSLKDKETAIWILGEICAKDKLSLIEKATAHKTVNIRRLAVSALGKIKDRSSEEILIKSLEDSNSQVVLYSIKSLQKIQSKKAEACIGKLIYSEKEYIKRAAIEFCTVSKDWE